MSEGKEKQRETETEALVRCFCFQCIFTVRFSDEEIESEVGAERTTSLLTPERLNK